MMPLTRFAQFLFLFILTFGALRAGEKAKYDIAGTAESRTGALSKTMSPAASGWVIHMPAGEAAVLPGCYYTLGTAAGLSGTRLDSASTVTYGHPFAKTSFAIFHIDGTWGKSEEFFSLDPGDARVFADSIVLSYTNPSHIRARFTAALADGGKQIRLTSTLINQDAATHTLGLGLALDPALGNRGDGIAWVNGTSLAADTVLSAPALAGGVALTERSSAHKGIRVALSFPEATPTICDAGNWHDMLLSDAPIEAFAPARKIYDLLLKMYWSPVPVPAGDSLSRTVLVNILPPDFGNTAFIRWDVPAFATLDDGLLFPREFTSWVTVANLSPAYQSGMTVDLRVQFPVTASATSRTVDIGSSSFRYASFPLSLDEVYEDKIVDLSVVCRSGGQVVDSLVRPLFVPATPVSDTGLTVTIDSVITSAYPQVGLIVESQRNADHMKLYGLRAENIFLYENGTRITDFSLGKDTSGGAGEADIVFVLDVTGSMGNEIDAVKNNIIEFADSLGARGVDVRLGMVTFLDAIENVYNFTSDVAAFRQNVAMQNAHGGDDEPENSLDALYRASEMPFRDGANRIIVWITDADYHEQDWATVRSRQQVIDRLLLTDITVNAIGDPSYQVAAYNPIVNATGGQFYDIGGNFRDILLDIGRLHGVARYQVLYTSPATGAGTREVAVTVHYAGLGGTGTVTYSTTSGKAEKSIACYPNPFNPELRILLNLGNAVRATVTLYDVLGRQVRTYERSGGGGGRAEIVWDATNDQGHEVATGVYFVRLVLYGSGNTVTGSSLEKVLHLK